MPSWDSPSVRPVWAGIVIRMADGSLQAIELEQDLEASMSTDQAIIEDWRGRLVRHMPTRIEVTVSGYAASMTSRWSEAATDAAPPMPAKAITASPLEIEP